LRDAKTFFFVPIACINDAPRKSESVEKSGSIYCSVKFTVPEIQRRRQATDGAKFV
jgi:hypothetical protein